MVTLMILPIAMLFQPSVLFASLILLLPRETAHATLANQRLYFTIIANLLMGGYTGVLTISVSIVRNALILKKKNTKVITICLVLIQIAFRYL